MELALKRYPISVQMYHIMAEQGAFAPDERVELFEGEIIEMSPIGSRHARIVDFLNHFFSTLDRTDLIVRIQNPIVVSDFSEPQPDISILKYREDFYRDAHPTGSDVLFVVEVADTSVEFDRSTKIPKYAAAGIPETWLINLEAERIEVHFAPKETTYGMVKIYQRGEDAVFETMSGLKIGVDAVLG
jgi:Uma2 family endonuclease